MRKSVLALAVAAAIALPGIASAQSAAAASPHTITGNVTIISDYRFRGITQTFGKPAIQGGIDYAHASGFYAGNWNSNISDTAGFPGGNIEMDFYGGYKKAWGDLGLDVGLLYYYYPGSNAAGGGTQTALFNPHNPTKTTSGTVHNTEFYIGGSWKWISLKWNRSLSDYFLIPDTKGSDYLDLTATYDVGGGWGVIGHIGKLKVHNFSEAGYTDYKLGVTKDVNGWILGASLISTNAKDSCSGGAGGTPAGSQPYCFGKPDGTGFKTYEAGKSAVLLSIGKTF
jgi:uncharacterized protein (TIGR02001 family)